MSTCQFPMLVIVFVSTYIRSIEWCACKYVLFMLQWANLAIGGVESFWCTVLDHYNLNFKTQQSHCQRAKPGFFLLFLVHFTKVSSDPPAWRLGYPDYPGQQDPKLSGWGPKNNYCLLKHSNPHKYRRISNFKEKAQKKIPEG